MPSKEEKALLKSLFKTQEKTAFEKSLPISKTQFQELFDFLDSKLGDAGCDDTLKFCNEFFAKNSIANFEEVIGWLKENGGFCDCEVLANIEEQFED